MKRLILSIIMVCVFIMLSASDHGGPSYYFNPNYQLGSLLHPNTVKMNHSMSFMSGTSSSGQGYYQSSYTNHLRFDLRHNLKFNVDLSYVNFGTMQHKDNMKFSSNKDNQGVVVPAFSLEYKPSENSVIYLQYQQVRGYQPQNPFHRNDEWWR